MKKLVFGMLATVMFSFLANAQGLRENFLSGKTYDEISGKYSKLSVEEKSALWIEKMDQLQSLDLPLEHKSLIGKVKEQILRGNLSENPSDLIEAAIKLALITPEDDFIKMFSSLYDYNYNAKFAGVEKVSDNILNDIKRLGAFSNNNDGGGASKDCNCRWTCSWYNRDGSVKGSGSSEKSSQAIATSCHITSSGCGFLWASECDGYVGF